MAARALLLLVLLVLGGCGREEAVAPVDPLDESPQAALIRDLREGGHVLVVRHTTTESATDRVEVVGDCGTQRALNAQGRQEARELGAALRELEVPVGDVRSSPLCRTHETAALAFGRTRDDLGLVSPGVVGTEADDRARAVRLRERVASPPPGPNTVLVTHTGSIGDAFGLSVLEGEALVFGPGGGEGGPVPAGRLTLQDLRDLTAGG